MNATAVAASHVHCGSSTQCSHLQLFCNGLWVPFPGRLDFQKAFHLHSATKQTSRVGLTKDENTVRQKEKNAVNSNIYSGSSPIYFLDRGKTCVILVYRSCNFGTSRTICRLKFHYPCVIYSFNIWSGKRFCLESTFVQEISRLHTLSQ